MMYKTKLTIGLLIIISMIIIGAYDINKIYTDNKENEELLEIITGYEKKTKFAPTELDDKLIFNTSMVVTDYLLLKNPDHSPVSYAVIPFCSFL
ncbi:MAG: hypothetical protein WAV10_02670, partial [Minisyncoccia bacterium]